MMHYDQEMQVYKAQVFCYNCKKRFFLNPARLSVLDPHHVALNINTYLRQSPFEDKLDYYQVFCRMCYGKMHHEEERKINKLGVYQVHVQNRENQLRVILDKMTHKIEKEYKMLVQQLASQSKYFQDKLQVIEYEIQKNVFKMQLYQDWNYISHDLSGIHGIQNSAMRKSLYEASSDFGSHFDENQILSMEIEESIGLNLDISQSYLDFNKQLKGDHPFEDSLRNLVKGFGHFMKKEVSNLQQKMSMDIEQLNNKKAQLNFEEENIYHMRMICCSGCKGTIFFNTSSTFKKVAQSHFQMGVNYYILNSAPERSTQKDTVDVNTFEIFCTDCFDAYCLRVKEKMKFFDQNIGKKAQRKVKILTEEQKIIQVLEKPPMPKKQLEKRVMLEGIAGVLTNLYDYNNEQVKQLKTAILKEKDQKLYTDLLKEHGQKIVKVDPYFNLNFIDRMDKGQEQKMSQYYRAKDQIDEFGYPYRGDVVKIAEYINKQREDEPFPMLEVEQEEYIYQDPQLDEQQDYYEPEDEDEDDFLYHQQEQEMVENYQEQQQQDEYASCYRPIRGQAIKQLGLEDDHLEKLMFQLKYGGIYQPVEVKPQKPPSINEPKYEDYVYEQFKFDLMHGLSKPIEVKPVEIKSVEVKAPEEQLMIGDYRYNPKDFEDKQQQYTEEQYLAMLQNQFGS